MLNFSGVAIPLKSPNYIWDKPNLFANTLLCSDSFQYVIFPQSLVDADFFISGIGPDILMKVFEDYIILFIWAAWVLLVFILSRNKSFGSGALLEIPLLSPFMKGFGQ